MYCYYVGSHSTLPQFLLIMLAEFVGSCLVSPGMQTRKNLIHFTDVQLEKIDGYVYY